MIGEVCLWHVWWYGQNKLFQEKIEEYQLRTKQAQKKANKLKRMSDRIAREYKMSLLMEKQYKKEVAEGKNCQLCPMST